MNMRPVAVIGVGMTAHTSYFPEKTWGELAAEAVWEALDDAGRAIAEVEGGLVSFHGEMMTEMGNIGSFLADQIGAKNASFAQISAACSGGGVGTYLGWQMVASGRHDLVLVVGFEKGGDVYDYLEAILPSSHIEYDYTFGITHIDWLALMSRFYRDRYAVAEEAIDKWVDQSLWYARRHPKSLYLSTPGVAREVTRYHRSASRAEGAAAVLLAPADQAADRSRRRVVIAGAAYKSAPVYLGEYFRAEHQHMLAESPATVAAAEEAYRIAGIAPSEVSLAQVADANAVIGLMQLEALKLVRPGEAPEVVLAGGTSPTGRIPTNTYGGSIGFGHASGAIGLVAVVESVLQLRGQAAERQVPRARVAVCQSSGGPNSTQAVLILAANENERALGEG
jgi:acetyl-CoA acetyltransferase